MVEAKNKQRMSPFFGEEIKILIQEYSKNGEWSMQTQIIIILYEEI